MRGLVRELNYILLSALLSVASLLCENSFTDQRRVTDTADDTGNVI